MTVLAEARDFIRDLILGDFAENPSSMATIVNGAVALVPGIDQLLDVRDIIAVAVRASGKGWGKLTQDDCADIAFAAIGCIPTFGSFFKGAVKPLYQNRKTAGRGVQASIALFEHAAGMGKGGAIQWLQTINWAQRTQDASARAQAAIALYIGILQTIAAQPWWAPNSFAQLAKQNLPAAQQAKHYIDQTIILGSKAIQDLIQDLLGEHAVLMQAAVQIATQTVHTRGAGAHGTKTHTAAAAQADRQANAKRTHTNALRQTHPQVGGEPTKRVQAEKGPRSTAQETVRALGDDVGKRHKGLVGEHMVDYHVLREEGMGYAHACLQPMDAKGQLYKVNHGHKRPVELCVEDLREVNKPGIDSLWRRKTGKKYLVAEAKAYTDAQSYWVMRAGKAKNASAKAANAANVNKQAQEPWQRSLNEGQVVLYGLLRDTSDKGGYGGAMQMSRAWIEYAGQKIGVDLSSPTVYDRRVYLVCVIPKLAMGMYEHLAHVIPATLSSEQFDHRGKHDSHGVSYTFLERDIAAVEEARSQRAEPKATKTPNEASNKSKGANQRKGR